MNRLKSIVLAAFAVMVGAGLVQPVQSAAAATTPGSASLSIAPKKNYVIEPGKSVKDKLVIRNLDAAHALNLTLRVIDFTYTDDGGTPKLFLGKDVPQTTWSLKPFMTVPESVTIPAGQSKTLDMSVTVPKNQGAGSYYSAIIYSSGTPTGGGNVGLNASGVTLAFLNVPGKVNEKLTLQKFGAYHEATPQTPAGYMNIMAKEPLTIGYTLKNDGNVVEAPVGSITLKDMWGHTTTISNVNPSGSLALIGQTRTFAPCIKLTTQDVKLAGTSTPANTCTSPGLWPGLYTATIDLFYGQNGNLTQELTGSSYFWYLPWWFVIVVLLILAIVAYFIWRIQRAIRSKLNGGVKFKKSPRRK